MFSITNASIVSAIDSVFAKIPTDSLKYQEFITLILAEVGAPYDMWHVTDAKGNFVPGEKTELVQQIVRVAESLHLQTYSVLFRKGIGAGIRKLDDKTREELMRKANEKAAARQKWSDNKRKALAKVLGSDTFPGLDRMVEDAAALHFKDNSDE